MAPRKRDTQVQEDGQTVYKPAKKAKTVVKEEPEDKKPVRLKPTRTKTGRLKPEAEKEEKKPDKKTPRRYEPEQKLTGREKKEKARAAAVAERMHQGYLARCVGKIFPVLFEQDRGEGSVGHAPNYMPVTVGMKGLHNTVQNVRITAVDGDGLRGEPEET